MYQFPEAGGGGGRCFGNKTAGVSEVYIRLGTDAGEIEAGVVTKTRQAVTRAPAIRRDHPDHLLVEAVLDDIAIKPRGRVLGQGLRAREEEDFPAGRRPVERPALGVQSDEIEAGAQAADIAKQIGPDQAHDFPDRLTGFEPGGLRKTAEKGAINRGMKLGDDTTFHAEPPGRFIRPPAIKPFGGLEPVAESAGVVIEPEVLENQRNRAGGRVIARQLVMVEIVARGLVPVTDIDNEDGGIVEIGVGGFTTKNAGRVHGEKHAAGDELVFVGAARVGEDGRERRHGGVNVAGGDGGGEPSFHDSCDNRPTIPPKASAPRATRLFAPRVTLVSPGLAQPGRRMSPHVAGIFNIVVSCFSPFSQVRPMPPLSAALPLLAASLSLFAPMSTHASQTLFLGNYADAIHAADFDTATGDLGPSRPVTPLAKASFLAKSADQRFLYAVTESVGGALHAFAIGAEAALSPLNSRPSEGAAPCDIALSPNGQLVAAANYSGGSVILYRVQADGGLGEKTAFFQHTYAANAHPDRQKHPHAHGVTWSPDGRLLLVPDLGGDRVYAYRCDPATGALAPNPAQAWLTLPPGSGPRHARFSPDGRHLYIINELSNTLSAAAYDAATGALTLIETVSTLPAEGFSGATTCAELAVHPAGHTVYASNRGHDSLAVFARDHDTGRLTLRCHVSVPANPRHFALSPDARWLLAAGQTANQVVVFKIDATTGALTPTGRTLQTPKPICIQF